MHPFAGGLLCGAAGGLLSGAFGIGGGIVLVPMLRGLLHLDQHRAQGVALATMLLPIGLPAVLHYRKEGIVADLRLVAVLLAGFLAGITGGAEIANLLPDRVLRSVFLVFLLALILRTWRQRKVDSDDQGLRPWRVGEVLLIGCLGGLGSGLLGIGGGIIIIPLLAWRLGYGQHRAQVTSLTLMLPPIGLPGVWVYAHSHPEGLPWQVLAGGILGFSLSAYLGARLATRLRGPRLRLAFIGLMTFMAALVAWG